MTAQEIVTADDSDEAFRNMRREGILAGLLGAYICESYSPFWLAGGEYEPVNGEEIPGYEGDDETLLLRRKSDGKVFEVEIDVTMRPARVPEPDKTTAESALAEHLRAVRSTREATR